MSDNNTHMNDDLLVKYLVGEATPAESIQVEEWINASEENRVHYQQLKKIWDNSLPVAGTREVDADAAFNRLQNRIKSTEETQQAVIRPVNNKINWLAVAASFIVICAISYFGVSYLGKSATVNLQSNNRVLTDTLPDGSVITLNTLSKLSYPKNFKGATRAVNLDGEAFFKVTPDKAKPFIIKVNDVTVRVVGTSFNIKSRKGKTQVIVETGIVNVSKAKNNLNLNPGEKTEVLNGSSSFVKSKTNNKLYSYYINQMLICDQTPLNELVDALNEIYGAQIVIARPSLKKVPITTVFKAKSLEQVLEVVAVTLNITVEHRGSQIILR